MIQNNEEVIETNENVNGKWVNLETLQKKCQYFNQIELV
ncbi:unnamed protein product [Paramecium pentaurelia]|uniref:Uncharacterized protein n=1 Tax=Paramecium pentaurelia TaxID=43138 RepID=A0A8S1SZT4_9CILI|nr:unnamed protein product [Paramecium pentaurelia]